MYKKKIISSSPPPGTTVTAYLHRLKNQPHVHSLTHNTYHWSNYYQNVEV